MTKIIALFFILLALLTAPAFASQNSTVLPTVSPYPGLTMLNNINSAFNTFQSNFSGSTAPSGCVNEQFWADTSTSILKYTPDCTNYYPVGAFSGGWVAMSSGFKQIAVASTGSANHYVVAYSPAPTAYATGQTYRFITNFANTAAADVNFNSLGAIPLKKQGNVSLASGDVGISSVVECVYDGTNCQITSELSQAATGTVTSVATSGIVTGGTITTAGTIHGTAQPANTILCNGTGSSAEPTSCTAIPSGITAVTQSANDNSTKVATTAYADQYLHILAGINFNGTAGTVRKAFNATLTKNGIGDYTVNFTSTLPDANYYANCTAGPGAAGAGYVSGPVSANPTASAYRFTVANPGITLVDEDFVTCTFAE